MATDDDWTKRKACDDSPEFIELFFPLREPVYRRTPTGPVFDGFESGLGNNHGREAKRICQGCPVRTDCLTAVVERNEHYGIAGGAGGSERRRLRHAWLVDGGGLGPVPDGPVWLGALAEHFARLDGELDRPLDMNGPGAVCGRRSTYARGHRDLPCRWSASKRGQALARLGVDTAAWVSVQLGDEWVDDEATRDALDDATGAAILARVRPLLVLLGAVDGWTAPLEVNGLANEVLKRRAAAAKALPVVDDGPTGWAYDWRTLVVPAVEDLCDSDEHQPQHDDGNEDTDGHLLDGSRAA